MEKGNYYRIKGETFLMVGHHQGPFDTTLYLENVVSKEMLYIVEQTSEQVAEESEMYGIKWPPTND
jgi:hypothetical protein